MKAALGRAPCGPARTGPHVAFLASCEGHSCRADIKALLLLNIGSHHSIPNK